MVSRKYRLSLVVDRGRSSELANYEVLNRLGQGGMGVVYRARPVVPDQGPPVALKILNLEGERTAESVERFQRECSILAALEHPGIVRYLSHGAVVASDGSMTGERPFLMMELVEGLAVDIYCERAGLDRGARTDLMIATCRAVAAAHDRSVVHRDLKPTNILVTVDGRPKLVDFGVAKLQKDADGTRTGWPTPLTPGYASPEQLLGEVATPPSDVFSLGVLMHEILTGESPFEDGEAVGGALGDVLAKALSAEPGRRYASAGLLADDLQRFRDGRRVHARGTRRAQQIRDWSRRRRGAMSAIVSVAALIISTVLLLQLGGSAARADRDTLRVTEMLVYVLDAAAESGDAATVAAALAQAETKFSTLLATPNGEARTRMAFGRTHAKLGDWPAAESHLRRAIELIQGIDTFHPGSLPYCRRLLGRALREQGRHAEAQALSAEGE